MTSVPSNLLQTDVPGTDIYQVRFLQNRFSDLNVVVVYGAWSFPIGSRFGCSQQWMPVSVCPVLERLSRAPRDRPRPRDRATPAPHGTSPFSLIGESTGLCCCVWLLAPGRCCSGALPGYLGRSSGLCVVDCCCRLFSLRWVRSLRVRDIEGTLLRAFSIIVPCTAGVYERKKSTPCDTPPFFLVPDKGGCTKTKWTQIFENKVPFIKFVN